MATNRSDQVAWEQWPKESAKAFAAFRAYRDTEPKDRSLAKCCTAFYGALTSAAFRQWKEWSSKYQWVARAEACDGEQDRVARNAKLKTIREMNERHAKQGLLMQQKAIARLSSLDPNSLPPAMVLEYLKEAIKIERTARGEPDSIIQENVRANTTSATVVVPVSGDAGEKAQEVDRVARILSILAEASGFAARAAATGDAETDAVYTAPTDAETGGLPAAGES